MTVDGAIRGLHLLAALSASGALRLLLSYRKTN